MLLKLLMIFVVIFGLFYIIWPIDLIPDIIPVIGWVDDVFAGLVALFALLKGVMGK